MEEQSLYQVFMSEGEWVFSVLDSALNETAQFPLPSPDGSNYWITWQEGVQVIQASGGLMEEGGFNCGELATALAQSMASLSIETGSQVPLGQEVPQALHWAIAR